MQKPPHFHHYLAETLGIVEKAYRRIRNTTKSLRIRAGKPGKQLKTESRVIKGRENLADSKIDENDMFYPER